MLWFQTSYTPTGAEGLGMMVDNTSVKSDGQSGSEPGPEAAEDNVPAVKAAVTFQTDQQAPGDDKKAAAENAATTAAPPEATPKSGGGLSR